LHTPSELALFSQQHELVRGCGVCEEPSEPVPLKDQLTACFSAVFGGTQQPQQQYFDAELPPRRRAHRRLRKRQRTRYRKQKQQARRQEKHEEQQQQSQRQKEREQVSSEMKELRQQIEQTEAELELQSSSVQEWMQVSGQLERENYHLRQQQQQQVEASGGLLHETHQVQVVRKQQVEQLTANPDQLRMQESFIEDLQQHQYQQQQQLDRQRRDLENCFASFGLQEATGPCTSLIDEREEEIEWLTMQLNVQQQRFPSAEAESERY